MDTLEKLLLQQKEISSRIDQLRDEQKKQGIEEIIAIAQKYQLTPQDIIAALGKQKSKAKKRGSVAPKYRNPKTGATWTGRGKAPTWIAGKNRSQFLIQNS